MINEKAIKFEATRKNTKTNNVARAIRHRGVPMSDKQQYQLFQTELTNEEKQVLKQRKG